MKAIRIKISNLLGIKELELGGDSVELTGPRGAGKTSVLDAIRWALTNRTERDWVIRDGAERGEILIETETGLSIDRKAKPGQSGQVKVKEGDFTHQRPAAFLNSIFTPLQLNPVLFAQMSKQEKNRTILNLIEFDWDINWIQEQFGEIPQGVDYEKHILEVLHDIQAESGKYYQSRRQINSDALYQRKAAEDIAAKLPPEYQYDKWRSYDLASRYAELEKARHENRQIEKAKEFADQYSNKLRGLQAQRDIDLNAASKAIDVERSGLQATIERLKAEIIAAEDKLAGLDSKEKSQADLIQSRYETAKAKLDADTQVSQEYAGKELTDISELAQEVKTAEQMRLHLNEYETMIRLQKEVEQLQEKSAALTEKINIARELPGKILGQSKMPIEALTVVDGEPRVYGRPVSNLSDGELLELCVDVTIQKPGNIKIILLDRMEGLDEKSREQLYKKCKDKGLQLIATRVTDSDELEVVQL